MHILVVDDSAFARLRIRRLLTMAGHTVSEASNGHQALQLAAENRFDAVTLDLLMPEMDGMELLGRMRAAHPQLPMIVVSADIQEETQRQALAAGATAFVPKSGQMTALLNVLTSLPGRGVEEFVWTLLQQDAFTEMMNEAMGQAANALASLLERRVLLTAPKTEIMPVAMLHEFLERRLSGVSACIREHFLGEITGNAALIFPAGHAEILLHAVLDQTEVPGLSEIERATLAEIGNVVLNAAIARLGDQLHVRLTMGLPTVNTNQAVMPLTNLLRAGPTTMNHAIVLLSRLAVGEVHLIVYLIILLPETDIRRLLASLEA